MRGNTIRLWRRCRSLSFRNDWGRGESACTNWRAGRAYIYGTAAQIWADVKRTGELTEENRLALRLASTWTIHQATSVVDAAYHMAGATAVFRSNQFERRFRDMHAIAQQIQARDSHYEDVGRAILATDRGAPAMDA